MKQFKHFNNSESGWKTVIDAVRDNLIAFDGDTGSALDADNTSLPRGTLPNTNDCDALPLDHHDPPLMIATMELQTIVDAICSVNTGQKGAAQEVVTHELWKRKGEWITAYAGMWGTRCWQRVLDDNYHEVWLYQYEHIGRVIRHLAGVEPCEEIYQHWVRGKLFGYSEEAIAVFISGITTI